MNKLIGMAFTVALLCLAAPAVVSDECTAEVSATLEHQGDSRLQFSVEVSTSESCARIEYDLVVEEQMPNGQAKRIRQTRFVKLDDGSLTELVEHRLAQGHRMLSYEARFVSCQGCDLDP